MVIARSVNETFPYVIEAERALPPEQQTVFHLRRLPASIGMALDNLHEATTQGKVTLRVGDQRIVILLAGLAGWERFADSNGAPVEFRAIQGERVKFGITIKNPAREDMIDLLPVETAEELAAAIRTGNVVTDEDVKN